jgi:hypothetical protein
MPIISSEWRGLSDEAQKEYSTLSNSAENKKRKAEVDLMTSEKLWKKKKSKLISEIESKVFHLCNDKH